MQNRRYMHLATFQICISLKTWWVSTAVDSRRSCVSICFWASLRFYDVITCMIQSVAETTSSVGCQLLSSIDFCSVPYSDSSFASLLCLILRGGRTWRGKGDGYCGRNTSNVLRSGFLDCAVGRWWKVAGTQRSPVTLTPSATLIPGTMSYWASCWQGTGQELSLALGNYDKILSDRNISFYHSSNFPAFARSNSDETMFILLENRCNAHINRRLYGHSDRGR